MKINFVLNSSHELRNQLTINQSELSRKVNIDVLLRVITMTVLMYAVILRNLFNRLEQ